MRGKDSRYRTIVGLGLIVLVLDQLTKLWTLQTIPEYGSIPVIAGFFDLVHLRNRGAAFGFLNRSDIEWQFWLFFGATVLAVGIIFSLARAAQARERVLFSGLGLVLGGAIGNLIDRLRFRSVVDFLDFYIGQWHWPAFNVADIAICCGAFLVGLSLWCGRAFESSGSSKASVCQPNSNGSKRAGQSGKGAGSQPVNQSGGRA